MKQTFSVLTTFLLIMGLTISPLSSEEKTAELNENQVKTINSMKLLSGINNAEWVNPYTVEVTLKPDVFIDLDKNEAEKRAEELIEILSQLGYEITKENTCVKLIDPRHGEIAYKCKGNTPS